MNLKKKMGIAALFIFSAFIISASAATSDTTFKIGTWGNFAQGALSITFDDNENSDPAKPEQTPFNDKNFHITLFVETGSCNWANCKASFAKGHEIASHSVTHPQTMPVSELSTSQKDIQNNVPGEKCASIAYPNCNTPGDQQVLQYYIAGRNCNGQSNPKTPTNWAQIGSKGFGSGSGGYPNDANSMNTYANSSGWGVELHHGIGSQSHSWATTSLDAMKSHIDYLDKNRDKIWVETFGNVARYIKERDAAKIAIKSSAEKSFTITVTDNLTDSIFNFPLSIRHEMPSGWTQKPTVVQGTKTMPDTVVTVDSKQYFMFQAVPNAGDVVISYPTSVIDRLQSFGSDGSSVVKRWHSNLIIDRYQFNGANLAVTLFDLQGKTIARYNLGRGESRITLPNNTINHSTFVVKITGNGKTYVERFFPKF